MHPRDIACQEPHRKAIVVISEEQGKPDKITTYGELMAGSDRLTAFFRGQGLSCGDTIAICMENRAEFFMSCWAAFNLGLYFVPISTRLKSAEIEYILNDCGAKALLTSAAISAVRKLPQRVSSVDLWLMLDADSSEFLDFDQAPRPPETPDNYSRVQGAPMLYTSGTTGFPKGVKPPSTNRSPYEPPPLLTLLATLFNFGRETVYLSTGPLYHATPLKFNMAVHTLGGTSIILERFDAETALASMAQCRVTHSQWVPTMFNRLLRLPEPVRSAYDLVAHKVAIHGAAPCPVELKQAMFDWWGPILYEYYGGSESIGLCAIGPNEWLQHRGSVGRPVRGQIHILDEKGNRLPSGETGLIYFSGGGNFAYHNDPDKTASAFNENGWATLGDVGYQDNDGFLYLTDRRNYVINVGGVNVYPQEAENCLSQHPAVADAAVFGIPHDDLGEEVKGVIELAPGHNPDARTKAMLISYCQQHLSNIKCPRSIDFIKEMPREPSGKLLKRKLIDHYRSSLRNKTPSVSES